MSTTVGDWLRVLWVFGLGLIVFVLSGALSQGIGAAFPGDWTPDEWTSTCIFQILMGIFAILLMLAFGHGKLQMFGFSRGHRFPWKKVTLAVFTAGAIVHLSFLPFEKSGPDHFAGKFTWWQTLIGVFLIASSLEEVLARGLIQGLLHPLQKITLGLSQVRLSVPVIVGALFFSAMHVPLLIMGIGTVLGVEILVEALLLGLIAGHFREITGSLLPAIFAHMLANLFGMGFEHLF